MYRYLATLIPTSKKNTPSIRRVTKRVATNQPDHGYQNLEPRRVLAGISFDAVSGIVTVMGTSGDDISIVSVHSATETRVSLAGFPNLIVSTNDVNRIDFFGLEGDDYFRNDTHISSHAFGGPGNDILIGGWGDDHLEGGEGNDILNGRAGNDVLVGNEGNNRLTGGQGNDMIIGGPGNDLIFGVGGNNTIYGGDGDDIIFGGDGNDTIYAQGGNDFVATGAGNNFVDGGDGDDIILAGDGNNYLIGGAGNDYLRGGNGNDRIEGTSGNNTILGMGGDDVLIGGTGNDFIRGGDGNDIIDGTAGNNRLFGDDGDDFILGGSGDDYIDGGAGNDTIDGVGGNNIILGGSGDDIIHGGPGNDIIFGGDGNDIIRGGDGDDYINGGAGNDILYGGNGNDWIVAGSGNNILYGQDGDDRLIGGSGNDRLYGGNGNDVIHSGAGNNSLFGGTAGNNRLIGGPGKNRFLTMGGEMIVDRDPSDATILFRNGSSSWTNQEIQVVDDAFHQMHTITGNTRVLRPIMTTEPLVYIKESTLASERYATNNLVTINDSFFNPQTGNIETITRVERQFKFPNWNSQDAASNAFVAGEVAREIGYVWASTDAMTTALPSLSGIFPAFSNVSGWTDVSPPLSVIDFYNKSLDNNWWYLKTAIFVEEHGRTNPQADFGSVWKFYFDPLTTPQMRNQHLNKVEILDELFSRLSVF